MIRWIPWLLVFVAAAVVACSSTEKLDPELEQLGRATGPVDHEAMRSMGAPQGGGGSTMGGGRVHSGKIVEAMQVPKYTYMLLDVGDDERLWTAVSRSEVEVGQEVKVVESVTMRDFHSRTLNRTFATIVFGNIEGQVPAGARSAAEGDLPPGHPPVDGIPAGHPPVETKPAPAGDEISPGGRQQVPQE